MKYKINKMPGSIRQAVLVAVLAVAGFSGLVFGPMTQSANAVTCRNRAFVTAPTDWQTSLDSKIYQMATDGSNQYSFTVPGSGVSGCSYVNLTAISGGWGTGGKCWSFRLFFPSTLTSTAESGYCADSNTVVGVGGPVANGTAYWMLFIPSNTLHFTIRD